MKSRCFGLVFALVVLFAGQQSAWADLVRSDGTACSPKINFRLPSDWVQAYVIMDSTALPLPEADADGWISFTISNKTVVDTSFYFNRDKYTYCQKCVTTKGVNVSPTKPKTEGFTCASFENATEVWIQEYPDVKKTGQLYMTTSKPVVKDFYVFLPNDLTWKSSTALINEDGKDLYLYVSENCGWYYRRYVDEKIPTSVLIHKDDDASPYKDAIGKNGTWETKSATPIPLNEMFSLFSESNEIYFVADKEALEEISNNTSNGWFSSRPSVYGTCSYNLAAIIYDTDASLHGAFSCDNYRAGVPRANACFYSNVKYPVVASASDEMPCIGVTKGMVESTLDENGRMKLTAKGRKCFGSQADEAFAAMFTATPGVNEKSCYNMPFTQSLDGKWEFDSDYYTSRGLSVQGGFYPVESTDERNILEADPNQKPLTAARVKRTAQGPVFWGSALRELDAREGMPIIDVVCNGPGWAGGTNCEGLFADGDNTEDFFKTRYPSISCVFGWSCPNEAPAGWPLYVDGTESYSTTASGNPRWTSEVVGSKGGRNQHFCFESHAYFRFKPGLKFNFRGDDDIWVFINNKLAVDLGGTHLAAPGYVDLDKFMPDGVVGKNYNIDIFFCDRRTTMSNVRIKTNIFMVQSTGIDWEVGTDSSGNSHYELCYTQSGDGSCAAVLGGNKKYCGDEIIVTGVKISYLFTTDVTGTDLGQTLISEEKFAEQPVQYNGGIDVANPSQPIIKKDRLKDFLQNGKYYLVVKIGSSQRAIEVVVSGSTVEAKSSSSANKDSKSSSSANKDSKSSSSQDSSKSSSSNKDAKPSSSGSSNSSDTPMFRVRLVAPFEFEIVMDSSMPSLAKQYAVMDMKGQVLSVGELGDNQTRVKVPTLGAYVVKVGLGYKRVNIQ